MRPPVNPWRQALLGLLGATLGGAVTVASGQEPPAGLPHEPPEPAETIAQGGATTERPTTPAARALARDQLLEALRAMKRKPEEIKIFSAMCYDTVDERSERRFTCPACGTVTPIAHGTAAYRLAETLPAVQRALPNLPFKMEVDATALCSKCGLGRPATLRFQTECADCQAPVSWEARDGDELSRLGWLYLRLPVTEIDGNHVGCFGGGPEVIASGAIYIHEHRFCPTCRGKHPL